MPPQIPQLIERNLHNFMRRQKHGSSGVQKGTLKGYALLNEHSRRLSEGGFLMRGTIRIQFSKSLKTIWLVAAFASTSLQASAFYGLDLNDLPRDGDVTVPGDYPIMVRRKGAVQLSGLNDTLTLNLVNPNSQAAVVQIAAPNEKKARILRILAGVPTLYNAKTSKEVTLRVTDGDVTITSIHPLKVQHPMNKNQPVQK